MTGDELIKRDRDHEHGFPRFQPADDRLIQLARDPEWDGWGTSAEEEVITNLFRAVDERDELRKKYEPCMAEPTLCSRGTCYACVVRRLEGARKENDTLRGLLGNSAKDCPYCGLPAEDQAKCPHGFPGCMRADDQQLSKHFGDAYALECSEKHLVELEKSLWREKFVGRLVERGLDRKFAEQTFEAGEYEDLTEDPVQCADEELSYWDDDGD